MTGINEVSIWSFGPETPILNKNQVERRVSRVNTSPSSRYSHFKYFSPYVVVNVCGSQKIVDLTMLEPYLKILTHGGTYVYVCNKYLSICESETWREMLVNHTPFVPQLLNQPHTFYSIVLYSVMEDAFSWTLWSRSTKTW